MSASILSACETAPTAPEPSRAAIAATGPTPDTADPASCWDKTITPAVIETETKHVLISPADTSAEGLIRKPAKYRVEEEPRIVQPRQEIWHQVVCEDLFTPEFIATLQRALSARGFYEGDATGKLDLTTRDAIASYQTSENLPGFDLTTAAAEKLGLIRAAQPQ